MTDFSSITLTTARLEMRTLREADAAAVYAIRSNAEVMRYHSSLPWTSMSRAHDLIASDSVAMQKGDFLRLGLLLKGGDSLLGSCCIYNLDVGNRRAEVGYELHRDAWGKGYMREALQALLEYGFSSMNLNRYEADIHPDNIASARALEHLGFTKEGHLRERWIVGDEVSDSIIYGLLRSEWRKS